MQHLEQLIYYGAVINAQNGSGNTPLHICSLYSQVKIKKIAENGVGRGNRGGKSLEVEWGKRNEIRGFKNWERVEGE